jgi:hypothetical protein
MIQVPCWDYETTGRLILIDVALRLMPMFSSKSLDIEVPLSLSNSTSAAALRLRVGEDGWIMVVIIGDNYFLRLEVNCVYVAVCVTLIGKLRDLGRDSSCKAGCPRFLLDLSFRALPVFEESGFKNPTRLCCLSFPWVGFLRGMFGVATVQAAVSAVGVGYDACR